MLSRTSLLSRGELKEVPLSVINSCLKKFTNPDPSDRHPTASQLPGLRQQTVFKRAASVAGNGSQDGGFEKDRIVKAPGDPTRREFTYFMLGGARFVYASAARLALVKVRFFD